MVLRGGDPMSAAEYRGHLEFLTGEARLVPAELAAEMGVDVLTMSKWNVEGCSGAAAAYLRLAVRVKRNLMPWRHNEVPIRFTPDGMELGEPGELV